MADDKKVDDIEKARFEFYNSFGTANPLVLAPLMNPVFQGGPDWPTRPAWKHIELNGGGVVWATNGLADPWSNPEKFDSIPDGYNMNTGLGIELVCGSKDLDPDAVREAVVNASHTLAGNPFILHMLKEIKEQNKTYLGEFDCEATKDLMCGTLSTTVTAPSFPEQFQMEGQVGVFIDQGLSLPPSFDTPHGKIQVLEMVVLFPHELDWIMALGDPARVEFSRRLHARNEIWPSSLTRKPCVSKKAKLPTEELPPPPESFLEGIRIIQERWTNDDDKEEGREGNVPEGPTMAKESTADE